MEPSESQPHVELRGTYDPFCSPFVLSPCFLSKVSDILGVQGAFFNPGCQVSSLCSFLHSLGLFAYRLVSLLNPSGHFVTFQ